jgi:hypothetical protein
MGKRMKPLLTFLLLIGFVSFGKAEESVNIPPPIIKALTIPHIDNIQDGPKYEFSKQPDPLKIIWLDELDKKLSKENKREEYTFGLREDGVVVWRKTK